MNQLSSRKLNSQESSELYPIDLLTDLVSKQANGCLTLDYKSFKYFIYLEQGKIVYATNSLEPLERIERHLRYLSHQFPQLNKEIRTSLRLNLEDSNERSLGQPLDYQSIQWLINQNHLSKEQSIILINKIVYEIFETYLLLPKCYQIQLYVNIKLSPKITWFELNSLVQECQKSLQNWCSLSPHVTSPYQRPYFFSKPGAAVELQKIAKILRGFNFLQLAAILNQNKMAVAKKLYPLILNKTIFLRNPQPPFDLLPIFSPESLSKINKSLQQITNKSTENEPINLENISEKINQKQWKIVCIDDSPTILNEISRFLDRDEFSVFTITESLKALMKIIRIKPDLILLDVGMPNIDGYKLCSLIRKYSAFRDTPIVMVTGNKSLIDRAKARMAGATDYMTKPFTQSDLLDMVFRYLS